MHRNRKLENSKLKILNRSEKTMRPIMQRLNVLRIYDKVVLQYLEFEDMGTISDDEAQEAVDLLEATQRDLIREILKEYSSDDLEKLLPKEDWNYLDRLTYFLDIFN